MLRPAHRDGAELIMVGLSREELSRLPTEVLSRGRNWTKADVLLCRPGGKSIVVKDFRRRGFWVRNTLGRFSTRRESAAYERLRGVSGVADFVGRIDAHALACAFVRGRSLPSFPRRSQPPAFFRALGDLLDRVHGRGIAVADLHHRNVIVQELTGGPVLIDFSLAVREPSRWNLPARWLFERAKRLDRIALERMRRRYQSPARSERADDDGTSELEGAPAHAAPQPAAPADEAVRGGGLPAAERARLSSTHRAQTLSPHRRPPSPTLPESPPPRYYRWGRALKRLVRAVRGKK